MVMSIRVRYRMCNHYDTVFAHPIHEIMRMWMNNQEWEEWDYEYVENNIGDCGNTQNEEYYLNACQVTDNGLD